MIGGREIGIWAAVLVSAGFNVKIVLTADAAGGAAGGAGVGAAAGDGAAAAGALASAAEESASRVLAADVVSAFKLSAIGFPSYLKNFWASVKVLPVNCGAEGGAPVMVTSASNVLIRLAA